MADLDQIIDEAASSAGYSSVKTEQRNALKAFAKGRDVFVSLPTGHGKSLCYALLPAVFDLKRMNRDDHIAFGSADERPDQFVHCQRYLCK